MPNRKLSYEVDVDTRDAVRNLQKIGDEGRRAGRDLEQGFDDAESAGKKAARTLVDMARDIDRELRADKEAADALALALEGVDIDPGQLVADLKRMGLTADDITTDVDELAAALREADGIRLQQVNDGLDGTKTKLGDVRDGADQSRSVLANMAGNTAQDLGEVGGVVGTLGVGLGQLAEYATEGNIALGQLAKVAGPMAGLAAAGLLVNAAMGKVREASEANAARLDLFSEAAREGTDAMSALEEQIRETGELEFTPTGFLAGAKDLLPIFDQLGIDWAEFQQLVADPAGADHLRALSDEAGGFATVLGSLYLAAAEGVEDYAGSIEEAAEAQQRIEEFIGPRVPTSLDEINTALAQQVQLGDATAGMWDQLIADMADNGRVDSRAAAFDRLQQILGLSTAEMAELAQQKLDEYLADVAEQTEATNQALAEARDTIRDINAEGLDLGGELGRLFDVGDQAVDFQGAKAAVDDAIEGLQTYIDEHGAVDWSALLDTSQMAPGDIDADMVAVVQGVRDSLQEGIAGAFELGGTDAAQHFLDTFIPQLTAQGLSPEEAYQLLGLPADGSIDAALQPYVDADAEDRARRILDALAGTGIDSSRVAQIQVALDTGQLDGEQAALVAELEAWRIGVGVYPTVDDETTQAEIDAAQQWLDDHPVTLNTDTGAVEEKLQRVTTKDREAKIDTDAPDAAKTSGEIDDVAADRTSTINTSFVQQVVQGLVLGAFLDYVARPRTATITVDTVGAWDANVAIDNAARDRTATIDVRAVTWQLQQAIATALANAVRMGRVSS